MKKIVFFNLPDKRQNGRLKYKLGDLIYSAGFERVFTKLDTTKLSSKLYTRTKKLHDTVPKNRINYLLERYKGSLLTPRELTLDENKNVKKKQQVFNKKNPKKNGNNWR